MKKPNPNLWAVDIMDRGKNVLDRLYVCAATASSAESKARTHALSMGHRAFRVSSVVNKGTIDVF